MLTPVWDDSRSNLIDRSLAQSAVVHLSQSSAIAPAEPCGQQQLHKRYPVAFAQDVPEGQPTRVEIFDEAYVVLRRPGKEPLALLDRCPHRAAALSQGRMTAAGDIQCAYHGWTFAETGQCTNIPQVVGGNEALGRTCATAIPVREKQGMLWLWPRPGADPDEGSIPTIPELDQPGFTSDDFMRDMPVDLSLLLENLLDPDHGLWAHQAASFDSYTASPDYPMHISEQAAGDNQFKLVGEVPAVLKMTGKDSASKTKPLPGEQATSAADLTARIVFDAPVTVHWSRRDQNDRTNFITAFYVLPVGLGRTRFIARYIRSLAPNLHPPRWLTSIFLNRFLDQDTYLLATQQATTLGCELAEVRAAAAKEQSESPSNGHSKGGRQQEAPMARRRWFCHRSPTDSLLIHFGRWLDGAIVSMPNRYEGSLPLGSSAGVEPRLLSPEAARDQVLDRFACHTAMVPSSMTAWQNFKRGSAAAWTLAGLLGAAAVAVLALGSAGEFEYSYPPSKQRHDLAKLHKLEHAPGQEPFPRP
eukprot:jgi/Astpho2/9043/Aster-x1561